MKRAVVYYSVSGNTKTASQTLAEKIGASLVELEMDKPLPKGRLGQMMHGGMMVSFGKKPNLKTIPDLSEYDEIILASPIWAGKISAPFNTLLSQDGVADKVSAVLLFSAGGNTAKCESTLKSTLPNVKNFASLIDIRNKNLSSQNDQKLEEFISKL